MGYDVPRLSETGMKAGWKEFHSDAHYKDEYEKVKRLEEKIDYSQEERELVAAYRLAEPSAQQYAFEILLNHPAIKKEDSAV